MGRHRHDTTIETGTHCLHQGVGHHRGSAAIGGLLRCVHALLLINMPNDDRLVDLNREEDKGPSLMVEGQ